MDGVNTFCSQKIIEDDLIRANANDGAVFVEKVMYNLALLEAKYVCGEPEV